MKTTLLAILAIGAALAPAKLPAQGTVYLNNYDSGMGIFYSDPWINLRTAAPAGTFFEIFAGASPDRMAPVWTWAGAGPVFTIQASGVNGNGPGSGSFFDQGFGPVLGVPSNGMAWFQIIAWWGSPILPQSLAQGWSPLWSQSVGTDDFGGPPPVLPIGRSLNIPGPITIVVAPEPSPAPLAALGLAGLLIVRRRGRCDRGSTTLPQAKQGERKPKMKTTLLALLALGAAFAPAKLPAQGTVFLNNYDSGMGIYLPGYTAAPAPDGTFVEVMGGPTASLLTPLMNSSGAGPIFTIPFVNVDPGPYGGHFDEGYGPVPGVPPNATGWFQILAWLGGPTYETATIRGASSIWFQQVGTEINPNSNPPANPEWLRIPAPIIMAPVPEPSLAALTGLMAAALTILRRRQY